ncbi:response regulator [Micromonospora siamensis]|uniref:Response regulator receiver domain-containing protein n=1 Tax=Micromonospora siamensis TaxID=299152 RepID=A0A1C5IX55_9ACTN|nr:response regulator [Micromonospora siamensis]SCG62894.1 Response regulator receiver domain-containing protein [Micromonospora siamensis]
MRSDLMLVVEDSDEDVEAITRAVGRSHPEVVLEVLRSGAEVLPRLTDPRAPRPGLVLLDLNLPGDDGHRVLADIRRRPEFAELRVVVFTSSTAPDEVAACYAAGADSYLYKPVSFALFQSVLRGALDYWRGSSSAAGRVNRTDVPPSGPSEIQT